jgi:hypothetical protein
MDLYLLSWYFQAMMLCLFYNENITFSKLRIKIYKVPHYVTVNGFVFHHMISPIIRPAWCIIGWCMESHDISCITWHFFDIIRYHNLSLSRSYPGKINSDQTNKVYIVCLSEDVHPVTNRYLLTESFVLGQSSSLRTQNRKKKQQSLRDDALRSLYSCSDLDTLWRQGFEGTRSVRDEGKDERWRVQVLVSSRVIESERKRKYVVCSLWSVSQLMT